MGKSSNTDNITCMFNYKFVLNSETEITIDEGFYENTDKHKFSMMGNALGGAIRSYLKNTSISQEDLLEFMGGVEIEADGKVKQKFKDSSVYISDVSIESSVVNSSLRGLIEKEGTAIDGGSGTAAENQKYTLKCLPLNSKLEFQLEIKSFKGDKKISKLIRTIAEGIESGEIRFGGHKNNDFGRASVENISISEYSFNKVEDLEHYLLCKDVLKYEDYNLGCFRSISEKPYEVSESKKEYFTIEIDGCFPYGVYQSYTLEGDIDSTNGITGIKNGKIPASSLKGLLRHETEKIINTLMPSTDDKDNKVQKKMNTMFGGKDAMGKVRVFDIEAPKDKVEVVRDDKNDKEKADKNPKYIKIDRLTGGKIDKALMTTIENKGKTKIKVNVLKENEEYLFPILLSCINIAQGKLPIGGRTSIGLGIFESNIITLNKEKWDLMKDLQLNGKLRGLLEDYYTKFKGWCSE